LCTSFLNFCGRQKKVPTKKKWINLFNMWSNQRDTSEKQVNIYNLHLGGFQVRWVPLSYHPVMDDHNRATTDQSLILRTGDPVIIDAGLELDL
jgi:hypothetical protein